MKTRRSVRVGVCGFLFAAGSLFAADGVWTNTVGGLWDDPANWQDGTVAGGETATAWLTNATPGTIFVKIPAGGVTAAKVVGGWTKVLRGGPLLLASATPTLAASGYLMSDIQGADGLILDGYLQIKTKVFCPGPTVLKSGTTTVYMNHMATSTNAVDGNLLSTNALVFQGGNILFQGRPNAVSRSHAWTLTEGETLITRTTSESDSVPGALVTGTGIPAGTYLKRIFSTSIYELSQPASLSGLQTLAFSAIPSVETLQRFERIEMNASGVLSINKQTMPVRIEAGELTGGSSFTFSKQGTGTFAVEKVDAFQGIVELTGGVLVFPANIGPFAGRVSLNGGTLTFPAGGAVTNRLPSVNLIGQTELSVPGTGTVVVIENLYGAGELVKTGAGTLQLIRSDGQGKVTVQGGRLLFEENPTESEPYLLDAAAFHTDASAAESLEFAAPVNGTNFVTRWADVRTNGVEAAAAAGTAKPFLVPDAQNGLPVLDFGSLKTQAVYWNYGGYLEWNVTNSAIREAFVVFSDTPDVTNMHNFFLGDSSTYHFHRGLNKGELLDLNHASPNLKNGSVSLDLEPVPAPTNTVLPSGFHLVSLSATAPVRASAFARDRTSRYGGIRLGEVLVYTNALLPSQRYTVNRYLWRKWFDSAAQGRPAPAFGTIRLGPGAILTLSGGVSLTIDVLSLDGAFVKEGAGTLTANHLSGITLKPEAITGETISYGNGLFVRQGGSLTADSLTYTNGPVLLATDQAVRLGWIEAGELVKSGAGSMVVGALSRGVEQIAVEGGTLTFAGAGGCGSWFHVDAAATQTLATVFENGTNFVTRWYDVRTNGIDAGAPSAAYRPWLQTNALNGLPFVDFGRYKLTAAGSAPCLDWNVVCTNFRSAFLVFSDSPGDSKSFLLGDRGTTYHFHREELGSGKMFDTKYAAPALQNGLIMVDQVAVTPSFVLPAGFHVISLVSTGPVTASCFARDRSNRYGGQRLAEVLVYDYTLPALVRQAVTDSLLAKWKGVYPPRTLDALRVADGGSLVCPYDLLEVGALEGAGSVTAAGLRTGSVSPGDGAGMIGTLAVAGGLTLANGAVVAVDCDGETCDRIDVAGLLTFGGDGTVQLNCEAQELNGKSFTLFTFEAVGLPENLAGWSVAGEICRRYRVSLQLEENRVQMTFSGKGTLLLLH